MCQCNGMRVVRPGAGEGRGKVGVKVFEELERGFGRQGKDKDAPGEDPESSR